MDVLVTGASGFLGREIVRRLLQDNEVARVISSDLAPCPHATHPRCVPLHCDVHDPALARAAHSSRTVIHLAATLGGAAEADPKTAFDTNVTATLDLMSACTRGTRFVFASSLAVLGETPDTRAPVMTYGARKAMVEIALETATRRGDLDGISLRPGGIVARRDVNPALKSAFLSQLFHAFAAGEDLTLPVSADSRTWIASVQTVATQFSHAATAPVLGEARSITLPMANCRFGDLVDALRAAFPESQSAISYAPDPEIMQLFGQAQPLSYADGIAAGLHPDANLTALIQAALYHGETR